jgi:hypothetical protein
MGTSNSENITTNQVIPNPTGKGGFGDNPGNRSDGRWHSKDSISYKYNKLIRMKVDGFKEWLKEHPESERTVAEEIAYNAVIKARTDLKYLVEITDRTEGKAQQNIKGDFTNNIDLDIPKEIKDAILSGFERAIRGAKLTDNEQNS